MLGKLSQPVQKLFGFVGASLTGITALFSAAGFLAERARLVMLGLPSTTFDLQQYLETGARFLAYLPIYLGMAVWYTLLSALSGILRGEWNGLIGIGVVAVVLVGVVSVVRRQLQGKIMDLSTAELQASLQRRRQAAADLVRRHKAFLLFLFLGVQFLGAYQLTQALEIRNILFEAPAQQVAPHLALSPFSTADLETWIRTGDLSASVQYLGWLFLITLLTAWGIRYVLGLYQDPEEPGFWQATWLVGSLLLLLSQIMLLPVNYGILMSSNRFPEVTVGYDAEAAGMAQPADERLVLLAEKGEGYYLFARSDRKIWYIQRRDVRSIVNHRMVDILQDEPPAQDP